LASSALSEKEIWGGAVFEKKAGVENCGAKWHRTASNCTRDFFPSWILTEEV
jgi:hypothetical protein